MGDPSVPDDKPRGFDDILDELSQVVERLERGDLPLEQALGAFERGVTLARDGERILGQAEARVETLLKTGNRSAAPDDDEGAGRDADDR